jgi:hypothetical protein
MKQETSFLPESLYHDQSVCARYVVAKSTVSDAPHLLVLSFGLAFSPNLEAISSIRRRDAAAAGLL